MFDDWTAECAKVKNNVKVAEETRLKVSSLHQKVKSLEGKGGHELTETRTCGFLVLVLGPCRFVGRLGAHLDQLFFLFALFLFFVALCNSLSTEEKLSALVKRYQSMSASLDESVLVMLLHTKASIQHHGSSKSSDKSRLHTQRG